MRWPSPRITGCSEADAQPEIHPVRVTRSTARAATLAHIGWQRLPFDEGMTDGGIHVRTGRTAADLIRGRPAGARPGRRPAGPDRREDRHAARPHLRVP